MTRTRLDNDLISRKDLLEAIKADRLTNASDAIYFIENAPTIEAEIFPSEGLQKALENYKKPSPLPVCKLTHEQLNTPYGVEPIKQTIEADSGEAVAWIHPMYLNSSVQALGGEVAFFKPNDSCIPLYTSPQKQWVELTDEQIRIVGANMYGFAISSDYVEFARNIENALKEVNNG
jgi:hypothetical protein